MKIRTGFVSNSSSSSFICQVCNHMESGYDVSPSELGFVSCKNGHMFCEEHLLPLPQTETLTDSDEDEWGEDSLEFEENEDIYEDEEFEDEIPIERCPLCQFKDINSDEFFKYTLKDAGVSKEELLSALRDRFGLYSEFKRYIR